MSEITDQKPVQSLNRLSREFINSLPILRFGGEVITVNGSSHGKAIIERLMREKQVGFDTESRPSFTKGISYPISLIQLATKDTAFLFQVGNIPFPQYLITFLENPGIKKIGIGLDNDLKRLRQIQQFSPAGFVDLSKIAEKKGIIQTGARGLTARYLNHRLSKIASRTNWAVGNLSDKQRIYAATDAWICLHIYPVLLNDMTDYSSMGDELLQQGQNQSD